MVKRIEKPPVYQAEPESDFQVSSMPDGVIKAVDAILAQTIAVKRLRWIEGHGVGQYEGLTEHVTERFKVRAPKCDPATCRMHVEVQAYDRTAVDASLHLECPLIEALSWEEAQGPEARCRVNHQETRAAFYEYAISTGNTVEAATSKQRSAKLRLAEAERDLDNVL